MNAIVIGAGLSGLAAAQRLVHGGIAVTLIEARNRVGGRVLTVHDQNSAIELGAEWVGNTGALHTLLLEAGATVSEVDGRYLRRTSDGFRNANDPEDDARPMLKRALSLRGPDRSFRDALVELGVSEADARAALRYIENFHAADAADVGIRWLAEVEETQSASESRFRCEQGLDRAIFALGENTGGSCDILLETVARGVRWGPYGVEVDIQSLADVDTLRARAAVVTVPVSLLDELKIEPAIAARKEAASRVRMGTVVKVVLQFRDRIWERREALEDVAFLFTNDEKFPVLWTGASTFPTLVAWAAGPRALGLSASSDDEIVSAAIQSAASALGLTAAEIGRELVCAHFHNWTRDPFSRGAYTYMAVDGADAPAVLARPAGDALFFAGEATIGGGYNATMEGAIQSGLRAAEELLAAHAGASPSLRR